MDEFMTQDIFKFSNISKDPETKGFDLQAGQTWIYPTNYPVRDYQYNIIKEALYKNTLVSLPTGLGKTFIAAVVMYNFFRWYPHGKIIFMAPTKPLVKQQVDACYNIMAIPKENTSELTGTTNQANRAEIWKNKRVFFITPHVLQNDLGIIEELGSEIKCLVFDEAHRARGNYAYCEVIRRLTKKTKMFRVLALSATPGNSVKDIVDVIENLLISHLEFRTEESIDVMPYVFQRSLETIIIPLDEKLVQVKTEYIKILEKYTTFLRRCDILRGDCSNFTKGKIFMTLKNFQRENQNGRYSTPKYNEIVKNLNICITLYHAFELLIRHGLRSFLSFFEEHIHKPLLSDNDAIKSLMEDVRDYLGPPLELEPTFDGTYKEISSEIKFGHPKFHKLKDILVGHFITEEDSKVIVFFEFRESVMEAYVLLRTAIPIIRPRVFLGQSSGITQKVQNSVIKAFREGECNTLLSTSIGEEGLDVGEVDLIICFDISNKSPIRMIQRMGRTGRKRAGRIIALVTEGKEQQTLKDCLHYKKNLGANILNARQITQGMYPDCPRLVPPNIEPKCEKMFITVQKQQPKVLTKNNNIAKMFNNMKGNSKDGSNIEEEVNEDFADDKVQIKNRINLPTQFWNLENPLENQGDIDKIRFNGSLEKQRALQKVGIVKHAKGSSILVELLQFADSKRFNIPLTQDNLNNMFDARNLKQGDIRNMFAKPNQVIGEDNTIGSPRKISTKPYESELFTEISNFLAIDSSIIKTCKFCNGSLKCTYDCVEPKFDLKNIVIPDDSVYQSITMKDLDIFAQQLTPESQKIIQNFNNTLDIDIKELEEVFCDNDMNTSLQIEEENIENKKITFEAPQNFANILIKFKEISPKRVVESKSESEEDLNEAEILAFFKVYRREDLFTNKSDEQESPKLDDSQKTIIYSFDDNINSTKVVEDGTCSPDIFDDSPVSNKSIPVISPENSPILCSAKKIDVIKAKRKIFDNSFDSAKKPNLGKLKTPVKSFFDTSPVSNSKTNEKNEESTRPLKSFFDTSPVSNSKANEESKRPLKSFFDTSPMSSLEQNNKNEESKRAPISFFDTSPVSNSKANDKNEESKRPLKSFIDTSPVSNSKVNDKNEKSKRPLRSFFDTSPMSSLEQNDKNEESKRPLKSFFDTSPMSSLEQNDKNEIVENLGNFFNLSTFGIDEESLNKLCTQVEKKGTNTSKTTEGKIAISNKFRDNDLGVKPIIDRSPPKPEKTKQNKTNRTHFDLDEESFKKSPIKTANSNKKHENLNDFCNLSSFGLDEQIVKEFDNNFDNDDDVDKIDEDLGDFVNLSAFGIDEKTVMNYSNSNKEKNTNKKAVNNSLSSLFNVSDISNTSVRNDVKERDSDATVSDLELSPPKNQSNKIKDGDSTVSDLDEVMKPKTVTRYSPTIRRTPKSGQKLPLSLGVKKGINNDSDSDFEDSVKRRKRFSPTLRKTPKTPKSQLTVTQAINYINDNKTQISQKTDTATAELLDLSDVIDISGFLSAQPEAPSPMIDLTQSDSDNSPQKQCSNIRSSRKANVSRIGDVKKTKDTSTGKRKNVTKFDRSICNISISTNSDDDFEESAIFAKPKAVSVASSSDNSAPRQRTKKTVQKKKPKRLFSDYLDQEAELSDCEPCIVSEDEDSGEDRYDSSFVDDEEEPSICTQVQADYMKTLKDRSMKGDFRIPKNRANVSNVFSQVESNIDNTYINDSFCVTSDVENSEEELSELEILEAHLKKQKKEKKKLKEKGLQKRKKRIIIPSDESE